MVLIVWRLTWILELVLVCPATQDLLVLGEPTRGLT